ncbi:MAG: hypothetical protein EX262_06055 [Sphingomonadaceae bacterium]|nr:MAG: hypothetical protein EX262_06055 [Sphingomonadaceae bacterium]
MRRAAIFAIAARFVSTISLVACMIFHGALNLSLAVIDTEQTSMAAQYAGFGATILISTGLAAVLLVRARGCSSMKQRVELPLGLP